MVRPYEPVLGIDLGTTYSCAGLYMEDGTIEILRDEHGEATIPSVICFKSRYEVEVGRAAYAAAAEDPSRTLIYDVKRLIGKNLKNTKHPEL